jgi:hypothetical protein
MSDRKPIEINIKYSEIDGLKSSMSRSFECDQILICKANLPLWEVVSEKLQFPTFVAGEANSSMDEMEDNMLDYLKTMVENASLEIAQRRRQREEDRRKEEEARERAKRASLAGFIARDIGEQ